jgi:hypothetical protein
MLKSGSDGPKSATNRMQRHGNLCLTPCVRNQVGKHQSRTLTFSAATALEDGTPTKTPISDDEAMQFWTLLLTPFDWQESDENENYLSLVLTTMVNEFAWSGCIYGQDADQDAGSTSNSRVPHVTSTAYRSGKYYSIRYDRVTRRVELASDGQAVVLHQIAKGYDPSIVGSDVFIGFLPDSLQPYKSHGFLVYVSSRRTNGGAGRGQCGAGSEIYLNFLNTSVAIPKPRSRILIGSCDQSIELEDQDISTGSLGDIFVDKGKLLLHFISYENMKGSPTAAVSSDLTKLVFSK